MTLDYSKEDTDCCAVAVIDYEGLSTLNVPSTVEPSASVFEAFGVDTDLINQSSKVRPQKPDPGIDHGQPAPDIASGMSPTAVGERVIDAVRDNSFYIITHDDYRDIIAMRHDSILEALDEHARRYGSSSGRSV